MSLDCTTIAYIEQYVSKALFAAAGTPYLFTRQSANEGTYLDNGNIPSNKTGVPFGLNNGLLFGLWIGNELLTPFDVELYHHLGDEVSLTLIGTFSFTGAARSEILGIADFGTVNIPKDVQLAMRIVNTVATKPKNIKVYPFIRGNF